MRSIFIILAFLLAVATLGVVLSQFGPPGQADGKISVTASFYVLGEFARIVGGDRVEVTVLVPPGAEPHDWEPSPRAVATIRRAKVFLYHGMGLDPWAAKIAATLANTPVVVSNITEGLPLPRTAGPPDPHIWLDPVLAREMVEGIADALIKADPSGRSRYESNASGFERRLMDLDRRYRQVLGNCQNRVVIANHEFLDYVARRYGFQAIPISGISPGAEPSPARLGDLVQLARREGVRAILAETLQSPRVAEALAREVGAEVLQFNPLEGLTPEEEARGENYLTIMEANLQVLREALRCNP